MTEFTEISKVIKSAEGDFVKFYLHKNESAGIRLRKAMQQIRDAARRVRQDVQRERLLKKQDKK